MGMGRGTGTGTGRGRGRGRGKGRVRGISTTAATKLAGVPTKSGKVDIEEESRKSCTSRRRPLGRVLITDSVSKPRVSCHL